MSTTTGCQSSVPHRSFTAAAASTTSLVVRDVLRDALARRGEHGDEHHVTAPLRVGTEQVVVRDEAADDVLRRVDPIGPEQDPSPGRDRVELGGRGAHRVRLGDGGERRGVGSEGCDERPALGHVRAQHFLHGRRVRACPPGGVEAGGHGRERRADRLGDVVGQHPDRVGPTERRVREVRDAKVRARRPQHPGHERELVVLHEHDVVGCGRTRRRPRRTPRSPHVGVPGVSERLVERGPSDEVEEPVVQEPEHLVRHDVVVELVHGGVELHEADVRREPGRRRAACDRAGHRRSARPRSSSIRRAGRSTWRGRAASRRGRPGHGRRRGSRRRRRRSGTVLGARRRSRPQGPEETQPVLELPRARGSCRARARGPARPWRRRRPDRPAGRSSAARTRRSSRRGSRRSRRGSAA